MDSRGEALSAVEPTAPDLDAIKAIWATLALAGLEAATDQLLELCDEDVEARPYTADGRVLRGTDEVRRFFAEAVEDGTRIKSRAHAFTREGDEIAVRGSIRVTRPDGSFAEAQVRWYHRFRDGRIVLMGWEPRAGK